VQYRLLGDTGVRVSTYSLGSVMFGGWGNQDEGQCITMIRQAMDAGINLIDTADVYAEGESERIIGKGVRGRRDDVLLATKVNGPMGKAPNERGNSRLWIMRAVEASLRRLDTDHIDLYQLHRPDPATAIEETLGALDDLISQGKIRYVGTTTFPAWQLVEAQAASAQRGTARFVCEQAPYSVLVRAAERDVLAVAERYRLGVLVWSPLAGGWLAGRYRKGQSPPEQTRADRVTEYRPRGGRMAERYDLGNLANAAKFDAVEALAELAASAGLSLVDLAHAFTLAHPSVTSAIIGARTPEQLERTLAGADVRLDESTLDAIDTIVAPGSVLNPADLGWDLPWMSADARRVRPPRQLA
jgi:aryl-alcohol dehydrogenase-like predicted oxidoreductase